MSSFQYFSTILLVESKERKIVARRICFFSQADEFHLNTRYIVLLAASQLLKLIFDTYWKKLYSDAEIWNENQQLPLISSVLLRNNLQITGLIAQHLSDCLEMVSVTCVACCSCRKWRSFQAWSFSVFYGLFS